MFQLLKYVFLRRDIEVNWMFSQFSDVLLTKRLINLWLHFIYLLTLTFQWLSEFKCRSVLERTAEDFWWCHNFKLKRRFLSFTSEVCFYRKWKKTFVFNVLKCVKKTQKNATVSIKTFIDHRPTDRSSSSVCFWRRFFCFQSFCVSLFQRRSRKLIGWYGRSNVSIMKPNHRFIDQFVLLPDVSAVHWQ